MIAKIGITFGMELDTAAITTLVTSTLGASAATLIGRSVVSSLLADPGRRQRGRRHHRRHHRRHPHLLGNAYVAVLYDFCQRHPGKDIDTAMIAQALKQRVGFGRG